MTNKPAKKTHLTADTNIFYYLGSGAISKSDIVGHHEELWATPVNVFELLAGVGVGNWLGRKQAAQAIIDFADSMAEDPEQHLVHLFRLTPQHGVLPWMDACRALADAKDEKELGRGVADFTNRVIRTVKYDLAAAAKEKHYRDFVEGMIDACDSELPGYAVAARNNRKLPALKKAAKEKLQKKFSSGQAFAVFLLFGLGGRFKLLTGGWPKKAALSSAISALAPYFAVYSEYMIDLLATPRKPEKNDWGDLELFMYLQPGTFVATGEKKWLNIASQAGLGSRVRKVALAP